MNTTPQKKRKRESIEEESTNISSPTTNPPVRKKLVSQRSKQANLIRRRSSRIAIKESNPTDTKEKTSTPKKRKHNTLTRMGTWGKKVKDDMKVYFSPERGPLNRKVSTRNLKKMSDKNCKQFGKELKKVMDAQRKHGVSFNVPVIVERAIAFLQQEHCLTEEGIFRISGSVQTIKNWKEEINSGIQFEFSETESPHTISGLLKHYLSELPQAVFGFPKVKILLDSIKEGENKSDDIWISELCDCVTELPIDYQNLLYRVMSLLVCICSKQDVNKMDATNLGTVFGPTLIKFPNNDSESSEAFTDFLDMNIMARSNLIVKKMITFFGDIFSPSKYPIHVDASTMEKIEFVEFLDQLPMKSRKRQDIRNAFMEDKENSEALANNLFPVPVNTNTEQHRRLTVAGELPSSADVTFSLVFNPKFPNDEDNVESPKKKRKIADFDE